MRSDARQSCQCALAQQPLSLPGLAARQPAAAARRAPPAGRQMSPRSPPTKPGGQRRPILYTQPCRRGGAGRRSCSKQSSAAGGRRAADHMEDTSTGALRGVQGCTRPEPKQRSACVSPPCSEARAGALFYKARAAFLSKGGRFLMSAPQEGAIRAARVIEDGAGGLARARLG